MRRIIGQLEKEPFNPETRPRSLLKTITTPPPGAIARPSGRAEILEPDTAPNRHETNTRPKFQRLYHPY